jgi:hypothetical protein
MQTHNEEEANRLRERRRVVSEKQNAMWIEIVRVKQLVIKLQRKSTFVN